MVYRVHRHHETQLVLDQEGSINAIYTQREQMRSIIADTMAREFHNKLQELTKLSGGVAVITVEVSNKVRAGKKKDQHDGRLNATRAGVEEGILPNPLAAPPISPPTISTRSGRIYDPVYPNQPRRFWPSSS